MTTRRLGTDDLETARELFAIMSGTFGEECARLGDEYLLKLLARDDFWAIAAFDGDDIVGGVTAHTLPSGDAIVEAPMPHWAMRSSMPRFRSVRCSRGRHRLRARRAHLILPMASPWVGQCDHRCLHAPFDSAIVDAAMPHLAMRSSMPPCPF